jgi:hypothetical protein
MIYIYNCYGGTHTSSLASAIHLGKLPADRIPTRHEILSTDYFDKLDAKDMGEIKYRGTDGEGNKVFSLGRGGSKIAIKSMESLIRLLHDECGLNEKIVLSNISPAVPPIMSIGGFLSRKLGITFLGLPLLLIGTKQAYARILELVEATRKESKTINDHVVVLDNEKQLNKRSRLLW